MAKRRKSVIWSDERRMRHAIMMRARWADPDWRIMCSAAIANRNRSPEKRRKNSDGKLRFYSNPKNRKRHSEIIRKSRWCIPDEFKLYYRKLKANGIPLHIARAEVDRLAVIKAERG